ncbi:hypothetical protein CYMTET_15698 [Cymbomonas tetramitiformis]|uniref:Lipase maturation factor 1/2 N-terminal domain-containing protein n=1 Tax=Cymbomonas tetramitiformis TaxID=36881 RepID=A0AAE0L8N5_9CHLO|nr:hypothetical protein CYMTET_15698 [Cymbomonas tetramitiformis]
MVLWYPAKSPFRKRPRFREVGDDEAEELQRFHEELGEKRILEEFPSETYWLTRVLLLRSLAFVFVAGFLTSALQNRALIGSDGLDPVQPGQRPTYAFDLFGFGDLQLDLVAWLGVALSLALLTSTLNSALVVVLIWLLYLSIVNLGSHFIMSYGWEWQMLETCFLAIFLLPVFSVSSLPRGSPTPTAVIWLFRWLAFRVMLGAGLSKINASPCWRQLTCTTTHYMTQPNPNPLAWFMHRMPLPVHKAEVLVNHFAELAAPWSLLAPLRRVRHVGAVVQMFYQACIISTGNYAFINWITLVPFVACFDDRVLALLFSEDTCRYALSCAATELGAVTAARPVTVNEITRPGGVEDAGLPPRSYIRRRMRLLVQVGLVAFIAYKSAGPVKEMTSAHPWLNFYDNWFFVNAYGVFGFINKERYNLVLSYTHGADLWHPLDFKCYPVTGWVGGAVQDGQVGGRSDGVGGRAQWTGQVGVCSDGVGWAGAVTGAGGRSSGWGRWAAHLTGQVGGAVTGQVAASDGAVTGQVGVASDGVGGRRADGGQVGVCADGAGGRCSDGAGGHVRWRGGRCKTGQVGGRESDGVGGRCNDGAGGRAVTGQVGVRSDGVGGRAQ